MLIMEVRRLNDAKLIESGTKSWKWANSRMMVMKRIIHEFGTAKPLERMKIGFCLHITKETSVLALAIQKLGGEIAICSANPLSVQNDVAAFLSSKGISVFAWRGESIKEYYDSIKQVLATEPDFLIDDGSDMHVAAHSSKKDSIIGGTEETTSGIKRLKSLENQGKLKYPIIGVNDANSKRLFDNRYGTGQSTLDAIIRITDLLMAGKTIVVCGYGPVGKGVSERARGLGAVVTVTEINPIRALEAHMDGFSVKKLSDVSAEGDIFITCTGQTAVIRKEHMRKMKSGSILANAGHFDTEIEIKYLKLNCEFRENVRPHLDCFNILGKKLYLLASGRVVNLVGSEGNAPEVMSMSFANQLLSILFVHKNYAKLERRVYTVPVEIDEHVAKTALKCFNVRLDNLTDTQIRYSRSYH
jgi:adenosylhomocysteinase